MLYLLIFLFLFFIVNVKAFKLPEPQSQSQKISLDLKTFVPPAPKPEPVTKPVTPVSEITPPSMVEPKKEAEPVRKEKKSTQKSFITAKDTEENNATKIAKVKPEVVAKAKETVPKKETQVRKAQHVPKVAQRKPLQPSKDPLANALMSSGSSMTPRPKKDAFVDQMVSRIYGKEFHAYSKEQQKFIKQHLGEIYRITQNTLWRRGYPDIAVRMQMQGTNIVSFYLHPNGDISDLHLRSSIGYRALDENTIEVIKTAYKDYPKPEKKTKIMFYVHYRIN
ncbi:MAG TPA: energy transducer TonB [Epsilonproteobacteria bacterium]|nr:energy transducer TonB [Campylobacterota bacterium]